MNADAQGLPTHKDGTGYLCCNVYFCHLCHLCFKWQKFNNDRESAENSVNALQIEI